MRAPVFWYETEGREAAPLTRTLLAPLSWLYGGVGAWKRARTRGYAASAPVICVGNLTAGGSGKTPVTAALLARLRARGVNAHGLSRGYGGSMPGPVAVDPERHSAREAGDEPLLLARSAPMWIARDRAAGAKAAEAAGAEVIVLDDGFQNPSVIKTLSLLVVDARLGFGNGRVIPAGPLREPVRQGLARAHGVILMGESPEDRSTPRGLAGADTPILRAWLEPGEAPPAGPLVLFAGIGRPQKFFDAVAREGGAVAEAVSFPDHHPYRDADLKHLFALASDHGAQLLTTEKDWVRLPAAARARISAWPVHARFGDEEVLDQWLGRALDRRDAFS